MKMQRVFTSVIALLPALAFQMSAVRAEESWERDRERYANWVDTHWHQQPALPEIPALQSAARWQPQPAPQQDAYRHHAWFGVTNAYYPRAIVPVNYGTNRAAKNHVEFSPLRQSYRYDRSLLDDDFCSIFGIDPLDCTCD
jgi:hypothetical protein